MPWTDVTVTSDPSGAEVYFIPADEFDARRLSDDGYMAQYRVMEGNTDTTTSQMEMNYTVVFEREGQREILHNVRVVNDRPNRVRVVFSVPRIPVEIWSYPSGAEVFFIPENEFNESLVQQRDSLNRFRIREGPTSTMTNQKEGRYAVVFELEGGLAVIEGYPVAGGMRNRLGVRFEENP